MYCKKCKFHSFDHVSACPKCGADWEESRKALYLNWISASGVNWLQQDSAAPKPATESAQTMQKTETHAQSADTSDSSADYLSAPPAPAATAATKNTDIDVSNFPDLDFTMTEAPVREAAPAPKPQAPKPEEDLFLETLPAEDMVELDFSASFDAPVAPQTPAPSKPKREDLFIPELEEMLAPLDDEPRSKSTAAKKPSFSQETEILLDFGNDSSESSPGKSSDDELSFLSLEDPKKP